MLFIRLIAAYMESYRTCTRCLYISYIIRCIDKVVSYSHLWQCVQLVRFNSYSDIHNTTFKLIGKLCIGTLALLHVFVATLPKSYSRVSLKTMGWPTSERVQASCAR